MDIKVRLKQGSRRLCVLLANKTEKKKAKKRELQGRIRPVQMDA